MVTQADASQAGGSGWQRRGARTCGLLAVLLSLFAAVRVASTYTVFSQTWDETGHIATGMEWLAGGPYAYYEMKGPLVCVATALGPYLAGLRPMGHPQFHDEGNAILHSHGTYARNLALARAGILPFFLVATLLTWCWARVLFGPLAALLATVLFTTVPPVLAHAGLATTDLPGTATFVALLFTFSRWLDWPNPRRTVLFGAALGFAVLAKISAFLLFPPCALVMVALRVLARRRTKAAAGTRRAHGWVTQGLLSATVAALTIWGGHRFAVGPLIQQDSSTAEGKFERAILAAAVGDGWLADVVRPLAEEPIVPAPRLWRGGIWLFVMTALNASPGYVLGEHYMGGRWYFFPVAVAVKTPLPFFVLLGIGIAVAIRQVRVSPGGWRVFEPLAASAIILLVAMMSDMNVGMRHVLPMYPLLAAVAGRGAAYLWHDAPLRLAGKGVVALLLLWQTVSAIRIHPDYLAYFNELVGDHPEDVLIDSDLDWGQDLYRLEAELRARGVSELAIAYFGTADLSQHHLPHFRALPDRPTTGWVAVSVGVKWKYGWLHDLQPLMRIGHSIDLYYLESEAESGRQRDE